MAKAEHRKNKRSCKNTRFYSSTRIREQCSMVLFLFLVLTWTHTPRFPMETEIDEELGIEREQIYLNRINVEVNEIFDLEISLPDYYNEKILKRGVDKKWCGLLRNLM